MYYLWLAKQPIKIYGAKLIATKFMTFQNRLKMVKIIHHWWKLVLAVC